MSYAAEMFVESAGGLRRLRRYQPFRERRFPGALTYESPPSLELTAGLGPEEPFFHFVTDLSSSSSSISQFPNPAMVRGFEAFCFDVFFLYQAEYRPLHRAPLILSSEKRVCVNLA